MLDDVPPAATITADTPLSTGAWVRGSQPLNYDAQDNVGVRVAQAMVGGRRSGTASRPCAMATPEGAYASGVPCPNGPGSIVVETTQASEGTQELLIEAHDAANNVGPSAPVTVRIDNTPPARVAAAVQGGEAWRNTNDFAVTWVNPVEIDRAPIVAAVYSPDSRGRRNTGVAGSTVAAGRNLRSVGRVAVAAEVSPYRPATNPASNLGTYP